MSASSYLDVLDRDGYHHFSQRVHNIGIVMRKRLYAHTETWETKGWWLWKKSKCVTIYNLDDGTCHLAWWPVADTVYGPVARPLYGRVHKAINE